MLVLFGGPAGAGKSTLARAWCATRERAAHVELDAVRHLIVAGRADPQEGGDVQAEQYALSVRACTALARAFSAGGYDVAVDDVLEPEAFERYWRPALVGLEWRLVVVLPRLDEVLARSRAREKRVREEHSRAQHAACAAWGPEHRIETIGLSIGESLALVEGRLEESSWTRPAPTFEDALTLAAEAHAGQTYPSPAGEPYVLHVLRVAQRLDDPAARIVAVLHDVVEDTPTTLDALRARGYPKVVVAAVDRLTRRPGEEYDAYVERLAGHPLARRVKLADLADNLANNERLPRTPEVQARIARYRRAQARLLAEQAVPPTPLRADAADPRSPVGYAVRAATPGDLPAVAELSRRWQGEGITVGYEADAAGALAERLGPLFLVGDHEGAVVGYAIGRIRASEGLAVIPAGVAYLEVEDLYVDAEHRSRGLGGAMLRRLVDAARAAGVERALVYSSNRAWGRTARFYEAHGFGMWFIRMAR